MHSSLGRFSFKSHSLSVVNAIDTVDVVDILAGVVLTVKTSEFPAQKTVQFLNFKSVL